MTVRYAIIDNTNNLSIFDSLQKFDDDYNRVIAAHSGSVSLSVDNVPSCSRRSARHKSMSGDNAVILVAIESNLGFRTLK
jgi:hypothetical protein